MSTVNAGDGDRLHVGVLLCAGRGRRAGGGKQLLPWVTPAGVVPLVAGAFDSVAPACGAMVVVLGHDADRVAEALAPRRFMPVITDPDAPMSESVRGGLRAALGLPGAGEDRRVWIVLHLGDHPMVGPGTLVRLLALAGREPPGGARAVIPTVGGRGGHPILVPGGVARRIVGDSLEQGLGAFWRRNPGLCVRAPMPDAGLRRDVDRWAGPPGSLR